MIVLCLNLFCSSALGSQGESPIFHKAENPRHLADDESGKQLRCCSQNLKPNTCQGSMKTNVIVHYEHTLSTPITLLKWKKWKKTIFEQTENDKHLDQALASKLCNKPKKNCTINYSSLTYLSPFSQFCREQHKQNTCPCIFNLENPRQSEQV